MRNILVKVLGFRATLIHGDPLVVDRWRWLCRHLPITANRETLLDIGCGSGAFTIGAARRGYVAHGVSWDERNQRVAVERAEVLRQSRASFSVCDVRNLNERTDFIGRYDVTICLETIEHILDDRKLMRDAAAALRPGGRLLLTTPNFLFHSMGGDTGPFPSQETGEHVRRGYTQAMLMELCEHSELVVNEITYCGGLASQAVTRLQRAIARLHPGLAWLVVLPLRLLPFVVEPWLSRIVGYAGYSICLAAQKRRYPAIST